MKLELTEEQLNPVTAPPEIIRVVAGPGTGKTRCVTARIIYLLANAAKGNILALSHTRKAIREIQIRIEQLVPHQRLLEKVKVMTLHAFCFKLAKFMDVIDKKPRLLLEEKKIEFLKHCLEIHPVYEELEVILNAIENCKNLLITPDEAYCLLPEDLAKLYEIYEKEKEKLKLCDFEDMVVSAYRKLSSDHELAKKIRRYFHHIIVDEAHDMNKAQYEVVRILQSGSFFTVLDPNQRIYSFRAGGGPLQRLITDYPESKEFSLHVNFRSGKKIVTAANRLMNTDLKPRDNAAEGKIEIIIESSWEKQAKELAKRIIELIREHPQEEIAVLVRTNFQAAEFAQVFEEYGIKTNLKLNRIITQPKRLKEIPKNLWERALEIIRRFSGHKQIKRFKDKNIKVTISTIHRAKGKEWNCVIVPDVVEELPCCKNNKTDNSEEKRIFYVAVTRPKDVLILSAAKECYGKETKISSYIELFSNIVSL